MDFGTAVTRGFTKYATFEGRASRSEYWYFVLFSFVANVGASILDIFLVDSDTFTPFSWIVALVFLLPSLAVAARRLHDTDRSGWWQLLAIVPIIGWILLIVWYCTQGTNTSNRFGPPVYAPNPAMQGHVYSG